MYTKNINFSNKKAAFFTGGYFLFRLLAETALLNFLEVVLVSMSITKFQTPYGDSTSKHCMVPKDEYRKFEFGFRLLTETALLNGVCNGIWFRYLWQFQTPYGDSTSKLQNINSINNLRGMVSDSLRRQHF